MRPYLTFSLLLAIAGAFVIVQLTRVPRPHTVRAIASQPGPVNSQTAEGKSEQPKNKRGRSARTDGGGLSPAANNAEGDRRDRRSSPGRSSPGPAPPRPRIDRPLRIIGEDWALLAPGVVANGGASSSKTSLFAAERLSVAFHAARRRGAIASALARGGHDKLGADLAILSLPRFVASYEQLRALDPRVLFVVGWSRGRDGLMARSTDALVSARHPRRPVLVGRPVDASTFFSLFALELAGVAPSRVRIMLPKHRQAQHAPLAAGRRPLPPGSRDKSGERRFILTSADAPHLVPIVAVAPRGLIKAHQAALTVWGRVWLAGVRKLREDVPTAARQVAALHGAPHAATLLAQLGQIEPATLMDNAQLAGLSGRSPVTLAALFARAYRIWRAVGLLSSPPPPQPPISIKTLSSLVRTYPALVEAPEAPPRARDDANRSARRGGDAHAQRGRPLLRVDLTPRRARRDATAVARRLAFLADIFDGSPLLVSASVRRRAKRLRRLAAQRFGLRAPQRVSLELKRHLGRRVTVTIFARN